VAALLSGDLRNRLAGSCGLEALHSHGIVHRDVKPANILVNESPQGLAIKLADLGLAWKMDAPHVTHAKMIVGTPLYMSPERLVGERLDPACDLWSLAAVAYECIAGRPPFEGATYGAVCISVGKGHLAPVAWFARALDPDPAKRFAAAAFARSFRIACCTVVSPAAARSTRAAATSA
jgi:eukaryotic-like serine/threonine-protein kinase